MSAEDAWFLYFEKADAPLHIGSVGIFEGHVPFEKLCASMDARMHLIPRYRQRAVIPPLYAGHPTWEDDPDFRIERHLRHVNLPAPGTREQLLALSSELFAPMLPRDRPLWDITLIHGIEGDRTGFLSRVHHCLVDGVSGIELLLAVLDLTPDPAPTPPPAEPWRPKPPPGPLEAWTDAMLDQIDQNVRAWGEWQTDLLDVRAQMRRMNDVSRAMQIALPLAMRQPQKAIWNRPISGKRRATWTEMSFKEVRGIRSALGGTVNDVMLTLLGGALGSYLRAHGVNTSGLTVRMQIPVNVRSEDQKGALGNRVSMMLPSVPVGIIDPAQRLQAVRAEMERLKSNDQASAFEALAELFENIPAAYHALAGMNGVPQGAVNLVCTNVPGPLIPLYSVGHRLLAHYPMVPLAADLGVGAGITSYDKALYVGIMSDPEIVGDVDRIGEFIDAEFRALREAAGVAVSDATDVEIGHRAQAASPNGHATNGATPEPVRATRASASS
jgi:WS/DGAT/MGAT family acyltransferase